MPIETTTTVNLTPLERAAIDELKADGQTAEEYVQANSTTQERLDAIVNNYVVAQTQADFLPVGEAIVVAKLNEPDKLAQIQPHVDAIRSILGLT